MSLKLDYGGTDQRVVSFLEKKKPSLIAALVQKMQALMIALQAHIVSDKLSGQMLQHRTGKLIGSVRLNPDPPTSAGNEIIGGVQAGGGVAWYARVLNDGGVFDVKQRLVTQVFGHKLNHPVFTKPYQMHFPPRDFTKSSLADMRSTIIEGLQATAKEVMES